MRDIYNMIIRRALSEVKKKIRPRPPGGSRFGFKPGPGSRAGGKGFVPVHERRTAGRCDLFGGQLMLTGLQADIGIQLCRDDVLRQTASSPMTYHEMNKGGNIPTLAHFVIAMFSFDRYNIYYYFYRVPYNNAKEEQG